MAKCNTCSKPKPKCGCGLESLSIDSVCNPIECSTETCSEIYPAECVIYRGEDIECDGEVVVENGQDVATIITNLVQNTCNNALNNCNLTLFINELNNEAGVVTLEPNITNGSGNYSYEWSFADNANNLTFTSNINASIATIAVTSFPNFTINTGSGALLYYGLVKLLVTDNDTGCQTTATFFVSLIIEV